MQTTLDPEITTRLEDIAKMDKQEILAIWERAAEITRVYKEAEQEIRKLVIANFSDPAKETGTETVELGNGYKLKIRKSLNYNLKDGDEFEAIKAEIPDDMQAQLFVTKTEIVKSAYEKLTDLQKQALSPVLTIKPGMPQVEIVAPKTKE